MADSRISLFCVVDGELQSNAFSVKVTPANTVDDLKALIKAKKAPRFDDIAPDELTLWLVSVPVVSANKNNPVALRQVSLQSPTELDPTKLDPTKPDPTELYPTQEVSDMFPEKPPKDTINIIVLRPPQEEAWQELVVQIVDDFFAPGSNNHTSLVQFVKGDANIPTTGGPLGGLPFVLPRAGLKKNQPSLLFLNLPESVETQDPPSTADKALEKIRGRTVPLLPLFGVSGCGKTRTTIEMLSKNWGFYFNGSGTDWGSNDLHGFLTHAQQKKRYQHHDLESNIHVHILALALVLTRVMILHHCLDTAEREGTTFTCKHWMLLQVGFHTMGISDLFALLFALIAKEIHNLTIDSETMIAFVQERFSSLHQRLLNLTFNTPSQRIGHRIIVVIDEAQNLGNEGFGTFLSQQIPSDAQRRAGAASLDNLMRPIFAPFVHGLYQISADGNMFCVVPCGTGLSVFDMNWLEDSAPVPKGYQEQLGPFTDFQGWETLEQVKNYRGLVRRTLPNDEARIIFDTRVPDTSVTELFERLRGRFRPIVSSIERMIAPSYDGVDWENAIEETEYRLSSTQSRYYGRGNIVYDILRMITRVSQFGSRYAKYQDILTILQLFVLQHYLHGRPAILNTEEAPLVEASVGRIMEIAGQTAGTDLDEPFALRAAVNFFRQHEPDFHSAICNLFNLSTKASVHGSTWEMAVQPSLVYVFDNKILSHTALVRTGAVRSDNGLLDSKARIVGLNPHMLGTDHRSMSLNEFLEAHVENGSRSRKNGKLVPAFYNPSEKPSGPDLVFVLHFDQHGFCPVAVQMKPRVDMYLPDTEKAFATVKADAVQGHLGETKLQRFCTVSPKQFIGVVVAYPTEVPGVEGLFPQPRRSERIEAAQMNQVPQCISLRIDKNNIHSLFPEAHMRALDLLKGVKRELEQDASGRGVAAELNHFLDSQVLVFNG
ncbi:hypothetical protein BGX24_003456 [Mortierella sp. AD032]|nr:hypothetical protein BGX24_003456 [Mortierella sp. AD032]